MPGRSIAVDTYKYGGTPHYSFPMRLVSRTPALWVVRGEYGRPLTHHTRGTTFAVSNRSLEFYWPDRPYTVAADITDGALERYYCNVILPPRMDGDRVEWVDLDLDLIVAPDLSWQLIDEDDFRENSVKFGYPPAVVQGARAAAAELIRLVESRGFPFDGSAERLLATGDAR